MRKPAKDLTDEELFDELREQVNKARHFREGHDRERTKEIGAEMIRRGWTKTKLTNKIDQI